MLLGLVVLRDVCDSVTFSEIPFLLWLNFHFIAWVSEIGVVGHSLTLLSE